MDNPDIEDKADDKENSSNILTAVETLCEVPNSPICTKDLELPPRPSSSQVSISSTTELTEEYFEELASIVTDFSETNTSQNNRIVRSKSHFSSQIDRHGQRKKSHVESPRKNTKRTFSDIIPCEFNLKIRIDLAESLNALSQTLKELKPKMIFNGSKDETYREE